MRKDILWKGIIEEVFDDLLKFIFPEAEECFDLRQKITFLDKELAELYPEPDKSSGTRLADKLIKVYRRDGGEEWVLIHLEIQGTSEKDFPARMFQYYYRIFDHWHHPLTAVAILTSEDGHRVSDRYEHHCLGTDLKYKYNVLRLCEMDDDILTMSSNPFATVASIARKEFITENLSDNELIRLKLSIAKGLRARIKVEPRKMKAILVFLNNYLLFKDPKNYSVFRKELNYSTQNKNSMNIFEYDLQERLDEANKEIKEKFARTLLKETEFSDDKIAKLAEVSVETVEEIHKNLHATGVPK